MLFEADFWDFGYLVKIIKKIIIIITLTIYKCIHLRKILIEFETMLLPVLQCQSWIYCMSSVSFLDHCLGVFICTDTLFQFAINVDVLRLYFLKTNKMFQPGKLSVFISTELSLGCIFQRNAAYLQLWGLNVLPSLSNSSHSFSLWLS